MNPMPTFEPARDAIPHDLGYGFSMPLPARLTADDEPRPGFTTYIEYGYSPSGPQVRAVAVTSDTHPVNGEVLREVRVAELGRENLHSIITRFGAPAIPSDDEIKERVAEGPKSGHTLALVQTVYRYAELSGAPAAKVVAETLGLSIATAGRWIRRSKDALHWGDE